MPYELIKKELGVDINTFSTNTINSSNNANSVHSIDKGHLLSTRDLCSLDLLPTLINLGITCFKIEGRLKNPEYVSTVTRIYRKYIDLAQSNAPYIIDEQDRKDLLQVFNRGGFSTGYLDNKPNSNLIYKNKPNNMGIPIGVVSNFNSNKGYITLKLQDDLSIGDTVSLEKETGSYTISELMINRQNTPSAKKGDIVKIGRIKGNISINDKIFKISSKKLNSLTNEYLNSENVKSKINCAIAVHKDKPISMRIYTDSKDIKNYNNVIFLNSSTIYENIDFTITSDLIPVASINSPITKERIIEQINKLGGTPFEFGNINVDLDDNLYIPSISKLNQLRRDCISKLEEILLDKIHRKCELDFNEFNINNYKNDVESSAINTHINQGNCNKIAPNSSNTSKGISILLNILNTNYNYTKLKNINRIYIPLKYFCLPQYEAKIIEITNITDTYIYMPAIMKDSVIKNFSINFNTIISKYSIKGFVISNISQIYLLQILLNDSLNNYELISNYNMNVYNNYTTQTLEKLGISSITLSPELDKSNLTSLSSSVKTEAIIYGNIPVMTTNYCILSKSNNCLEKCNSNCSDFNQEYYLKDRMNMNFRVIPDSFSKTTTIYNSKKTSISTNSLNANFVRLDFLNEKIDEICEIIEVFRSGNILEGKDFTNGNFGRIV